MHGDMIKKKISVSFSFTRAVSSLHMACNYLSVRDTASLTKLSPSNDQESRSQRVGMQRSFGILLLALMGTRGVNLVTSTARISPEGYVG